MNSLLLATVLCACYTSTGATTFSADAWALEKKAGITAGWNDIYELCERVQTTYTLPCNWGVEFTADGISCTSVSEYANWRVVDDLDCAVVETCPPPPPVLNSGNADLTCHLTWDANGYATGSDCVSDITDPDITVEVTLPYGQLGYVYFEDGGYHYFSFIGQADFNDNLQVSMTQLMWVQFALSSDHEHMAHDGCGGGTCDDNNNGQTITVRGWHILELSKWGQYIPGSSQTGHIEWHISFDENGYITIRSNRPGLSTPEMYDQIIVPGGEWHHYGVTMADSGTLMKAYFDGDHIGSMISTSDLTADFSQNIHWHHHQMLWDMQGPGNQRHADADYWFWKFDAFGYALSPEEVANVYAYESTVGPVPV